MGWKNQRRLARISQERNAVKHASELRKSFDLHYDNAQDHDRDRSEFITSLLVKYQREQKANTQQ